MVSVLIGLVLLVSLTLATPSLATTYYISPSGSDANNGTSSGTPKKTFSAALALMTNAGDELELANGTYSAAAGTGLPDINCDGTPADGTAMAESRIYAANERQAKLAGTGIGTPAARIRNCSYWTIEGLHMEGADNSGASPQHTFRADDSDHITFKRNLLRYNNRYSNTHLVSIINVDDSLFLENELYNFHRHGFLNGNGGSIQNSNNVFRRNYCNSRDHADIPGGWNSNDIGDARGDMCISNYPSGTTLLENNISEGNQGLADEQAKEPITGNVYKGNISLNDHYCLVAQARDTGNNMPRDTVVVDHVCIDPVFEGLRIWNSENFSATNVTVISATDALEFGVVAGLGDGTYTGTTTNFLAINSTRGFFETGWASHTWNYSGVFNNGTNFSPNDGNVTNTVASNPELGTCKVFIPANSPMSGAGLSGADIGANVLYAYVDGTLGSTALWDKDDGHWLHYGAEVSGVNSTDSIRDIEYRLNVHQNGCSLPSGYDGGGGGPLVPTITIGAGQVLTWTGGSGAEKLKLFYNAVPGLGESGFRRAVTIPIDSNFSADGLGSRNDLDQYGTGYFVYTGAPVESTEKLHVTACIIDTDVHPTDCQAYSNEVEYTVP